VLTHLPIRALPALLLLCAAPVRADTPPAKGWVVWESTRTGGRNEIYKGLADGTQIKRLTSSGGRTPLWAPDGRWIAYADDVNKTAYVMRHDGSGQKVICSGRPLFWLHDGRGLVCSDGDDVNRVDPDSGARALLFRKSDFPALQGKAFLGWPGGGGMTHDNRYLLSGTDLYRLGYTGANGTFKAGFAAVVLDLQHKDRVYFFGNGCWPFTSPSGGRIYHICGDCKTYPDIYRMDLADLQTRSSYAAETAHPDADWGHEYNPHISNDGKWLAYMASTGCHSGASCNYEIFLHRLGSGVNSRVRVTNNSAFDGYPDIHVGDPGATLPDAGGGVDGWIPADAAPAGDVTGDQAPGGDAGCECAAAGNGPPAWAALMLMLTLALARRRFTS
jgi:MYXO-CTERM domain-containing protein